MLRLAAEGPETPITDEWRRAMIAARKQKKLKQRELGALVGTSQESISNIERAHVGQSKLVDAISEALGIARPSMPLADTKEARWMRAGRGLREKSEELYERWLQLLEAEAPPDDDA